MNYEAVYRKVPATPGLLITGCDTKSKAAKNVKFYMTKLSRWLSFFKRTEDGFS